MRICIIAPGSRGDVQPYVALGNGLKKSGHSVRVVTNLNYETLVSSYGLESWPIESDMQEIIENETMREALEKGSLFTSMAQMGKLMKRGALHLTERSLAASQGMDIVVAGIGGLFIGLSVSEKLNIPFLQAFNVPFTPTRAFPGVFLPKLPNLLWGSFNRLSHHLTRQIVWQTFRPAAKLVRQQTLGLSQESFWGPFKADYFKRSAIIYGFSPLVIPRPSDWKSNIFVTGYWFLDPPDDWSPPSQLMKFLQSAPTPIYIGFGSMSNRKPEETTNLILQALQRTKQRAILFSGWSGLNKSDLPDSVLLVDSIPHSWLLPRVAAAIHHGGAGTTASGLAAGIPSVIIPFHGDQPFWGQRILALGVGPKPIPRRQLSVELLAQAIEESVNDKEMRRRAEDLGTKIRAEDGIGRAIEVINTLKTK
jgi:sterol 3beta-glucosyltransferase